VFGGDVIGGERVPPEIRIGDRLIGPAHPPYVVCELSANHNGRRERALELSGAAAATGADAIKIQTYTPDTLTIAYDGPDFRIHGGLWDGYTLYDLYRQAYTPYDWHPALVDKARDLGITLFSTPFDETAVDLLSGLGAPAYKIASFEVVDHALIARVAREHRPMIISTGMADLGEIAEAVKVARANGADDVVLLHCVSSYPAKYEQANLLTIPHLAEAFGVVTGLSDHTLGSACAVAAVALGACVVEKHFTLNRADGGPDSAFSLEPDEFRRLVEDCRNAWLSVGRIDYSRSADERLSLVFRRSLYVVEDIEAGRELNSRNIRSIRPGYGLSPKHLPQVLGRHAARALKRGDRLSWGDIAP
jgi:N-acetylneuraminate synthase